MRLNKFYHEHVKGKIRRWHVELIILGVLIAPMILMIVWLNEQTASVFHTDAVRKALLGIAAGVIGLCIWILGASVIVINILKEIVSELQKLNSK